MLHLGCIRVVGVMGVPNVRSRCPDQCRVSALLGTQVKMTEGDSARGPLTHLSQ